MGIALGLGAALSWGLADYFAAQGSRTVGALRVVLGFHLAAMIPLTILVLATGDLSKVKPTSCRCSSLIGAVGWLSYLSFYGALAIGPISVLSPIVSGYAAVTVLFAVAIEGEVLSAGEILAVVAVVGGVWWLRPTSATSRTGRFDRRAGRGFLLALRDGPAGGVRVRRLLLPPSLGWIAPIFLARGFTTLFILAHVGRGGRICRASTRPAPRPSPCLGGRYRAACVLQPRRRSRRDFGRRHRVGALRGGADRDGGVAVAERPSPVQWSASR